MAAAEPGARRGPPLPLPARPRPLLRRPAKIAAASASRYVSRASSASNGSRRCAASSRSGGASLPRLEGEGELRAQPLQASALQLVERAFFGSASSFRAAAGAPASCLACAAVSSRWARRAGSGVSVADRSRNAAAAARPPRARARSAERSSSAATSSSGASVAWARCHARRSGSISGSVAAARGLMRTPPLFGRGRAVDRRAQEGVAKGNPGAEREQARGFRRPHRLRAEIEALGRPPQQRRIADRLGRGDEQQPLALGGQTFDPLPEALLDPARQRQRGRQGEAACQVRRRQPVRQLEQCERIPVRLGDDSLAQRARPAAR